MTSRKSKHKLQKQKRREREVRKKKALRTREDREPSGLGRRAGRPDWGASSPLPDGAVRDELMEDIVGLLPPGKTMSSPKEVLEFLVKPALASEWMADEPEFEHIVIDPIQCLDTLEQVLQELNMTPESAETLDPEEYEELQLQMREMLVARLLTEEMRQEILAGLKKLRARLRGAGRQGQERVAQAAMLEMFLRTGTKDQQEAGVWPLIGLAQAVVLRSVSTGLELTQLSREILEKRQEGVPLSQLRQQLKQSTVVQKVEDALCKVPGLRKFFEKKADQVWEEGLEAVLDGTWDLGIFSNAELHGGVPILLDVLDIRSLDEESLSALMPRMSKQKTLQMVRGIEQYIIGLFTQERLEQWRQHLISILDDPQAPPEVKNFVLMLEEYTDAEDAVRNNMGFFVRAFFGELHRLAGMSEEEVGSRE